MSRNHSSSCRTDQPEQGITNQCTQAAIGRGFEMESYSSPLGDLNRSARNQCPAVNGDCQLFCVTRDLYVGRFASFERLADWRDQCVTDVVNVSDTQNQLSEDDGPFRSITWFDIEDRTLIPTKDAIAALDAIHGAISADDGRAYIHCLAGWNRSPTILWLYLLACGFDRDSACDTICVKAYDAVPGHQLLVNSDLIETVIHHGRDNYLPHPRPASLDA